MHICICYHVYPPLNGGVELCIQKLSEFLVSKSQRVTIICSDRNNISHKKTEIIDGVKIIYSKSYFDFLKVPFTPFYWKELASIKPDIIHAYGSMPGFSDLAIIYAKKNNIPSLLTYQFDGNAENLVGQMLATIYNYTINKFVVNIADKVIATGKSYAETSSVLKNKLTKITIIPNGIDIQRFNSTFKVKKNKTEYNLPNGKRILWIGRFVKYKGLKYLIKAMKYVNEGNLVVVGSGKLESNIKELVYKEKLENKVFFLGHIDNKNLPNIFHSSDIYVLSSISRGENFGISALEAMGCGIPVIASNLPGVRDLISSDVGITVKPKDINKLADEINYLLKNKDLRKKMGIAGRKKASKYSWDLINKQYYQIYLKLNNKS